MIVVMLYVFIRKRVIEISTEFFVIKLNSKMCAFSALYEGIGSKQTVQYLHRKKNQDFDQCVRCKYCTVAGGGDITSIELLVDHPYCTVFWATKFLCRHA